ncbi:twin-arginine translocation signal domain-containing protein [Erwinia sp. MYb535]
MTHSFNRRDFIKASLAASVVASGL